VGRTFLKPNPSSSWARRGFSRRVKQDRAEDIFQLGKGPFAKHKVRVDQQEGEAEKGKCVRRKSGGTHGGSDVKRKTRNPRPKRVRKRGPDRGGEWGMEAEEIPNSWTEFDKTK